MLHQGNGKNSSKEETMVVSQDCPRIPGSPVSYGSQRANIRSLRLLCSIIY